MAGQSSVFPVFIRAEYDPSGRGLDALTAELGKAGEAGGRKYVSAASAQLDTLSAKIAQALSMPRNAGGSLDFSETIAELKRAEQASEAFAAATREVASAQRSVLISNGAASREAANEVRVLSQLSREHNENTASVRAKIAVYEQLQAQLNKTASATSAVVGASQRGTDAFGAVTNSARAMRQATVQAGQQFQDIAISIGSGQRASVVLAQQLPQLAFALSGVEGKTGAVARLFAGPWGVALALGAFALGPLIDGLFKSEKASNDATKAYQSQADKLSLLKNSFEQVLAASQAYNAEQDRSREITLQSAQATAIQAAKNIEAALAIRQKLAAELAATNQTAANSAGQGFGGFTSFNVGKGAGIESELRANQDAIKTLEASAKNAVISVAEEMAKLTSDPKYKIEVGFKQLAEDARNSITDVKKLASALADLDKRKNARLDALKENDRSSRSTSGANGAPTPAEVSRILLKNFGGTITSTNKSKHTKGSDHYANQAVDFVPAGGVGAITKAQIEQALAYEGILIRISKKGKQLLGPGDKGHDKHFHVAFDKARGDPANTGKAIEAAQREAAAFQNEVDQLALSVARLGAEFDDQPRLIDRSTIAVEKLRQEIARIDTNLGSGLASPDDVERLKQLRVQAEAASKAALNVVGRDFDKQTESFNERLGIQKLILAGRVDEAIITERLVQLEERYGTGKRLDVLSEELRVANEILQTEDATQAERESATATISKNKDEYTRLAELAARIRRETTQQYMQELAINEAIDRRNQSISRYQSVVDGAYRSIEDLLSGGSGKDFFKSIREQFNQLRGQNLADSLFGDAFAELRKFTNRNNPENKAVANLVEQIDYGKTAVKDLADSFVDATSRIKGAANDNPYAFPSADAGFGAGMGAAAQAAAGGNSPIVVIGSITRAIKDGNRYNFAQFASVTAQSIVNPLLAKLDETFGSNFFSQLSGTLSGALAGYARAGNVGGVLGAGQGLFDTLAKNTKISAKSSEALSKISGKFGQALGGAQTGDQTAQLLRSIGVKTSRTGGQIGGAIGSFVPIPGGEIIGSIIGSVVGGLFKKTPKGSTTITNTTSDLTYSGSKKLSQGVLGLGGNVQSGLANIIQTLGGSAGNFGVSIGQRGKDFVVDPTGRGRTKGSGVLKFKDEQEASRAALLDAINDGAVVGIRQGAQNLLRAGKDIEKQLSKAADFQGVFDRLKQREDPLGFALDTIDREFTRLRNIFMEAGASSAEYADLERLYGLERADAVKAANEQVSASLKEFYNSLTAGNDARSLRERQEAALKEYSPLAARVASGDKGAYEAFTQAAQQLLDIERQIYGSQSGYFTRLDQVTDLTKTRVDADSNVSMMTDMRPGIFGSAGPNNDTAPVVNAIMGGNADIVAALNQTNQYLQALASGGGGNIVLDRFRLSNQNQFY